MVEVGIEHRPLAPESEALPLDHHTPLLHSVTCNLVYIVKVMIK